MLALACKWCQLTNIDLNSLKIHFDFMMFKPFIRCFYPNWSTKGALVSHVRLLRSADGQHTVPFSGLCYPCYWNFWTNYMLNFRISRHSPIRHGSVMRCKVCWAVFSWNGNWKMESLTSLMSPTSHRPSQRRRRRGCCHGNSRCKCSSGQFHGKLSLT